MSSVIIILLASLAVAGAAEPPTVEALLEEAWRVAVHGGEPQTRALALAGIAAAWAPLDAHRSARIAAQAVECAAAAPTEMAHALSLRSIAVRLAAHDTDHAHSLLQQAARLARKLQSPIEQAVAMRETALAALGASLDGAEDLLQEALAAAQAVDEPLIRAACLRDLGAGARGHDADLARSALVQAGAALEAAAGDVGELDAARTALAAAWAPLDPAPTRDLLARISDDDTRAAARVLVAAAARDLDETLSLAGDLPAGPERAQVIAAAAAALPAQASARAEALAREALDMWREGAGTEGDAARGDIAVALARTAPNEALELARSTRDPERRAAALSAVMERIGEADAREGVRLLEQVDDPLHREPALARLIPRLARLDPDAALERARTIISMRLRVEALLGIARALQTAPDDA